MSSRSIDGNNAVPGRRVKEQSPNGWLQPHLMFGVIAGTGIVVAWCAIIFARDALSADQGRMLIGLSTLSIVAGSVIRTLRRSNGFGQRILALLGVAFAMWIGWSIAAVLALAFFAPDRTADFAVVDALRLGMSPAEAEKTIASFSFERESALERPNSGWKSDDTFTNLPGRAHAAEEKLHVLVKRAEYYPVHHGLLGFGELFLFYDSSEKLVYFYRRQIN